MNLQLLQDALERGDPPPLDSISPGGWGQLARAVRYGALELDQRAALARAIGGRVEALPVLIELSADMGVALAISRSLLSEDSLADLRALAEASGLFDAWSESGPSERLVIPLARTLADPRAWWWLTRRVFHPQVLAVLPQLMLDAEATVRLAAVQGLANTPGDQALEALFIALHDTHQGVRGTAREALSTRCTEPALRARLEAELRDLDALVVQARGASAALRRIPGFASMAEAVQRSWSRDRSQQRERALEGLRRRFRLYRGREVSTSYVALAVAMAWADGSIHPDEAAALQRLMDDRLNSTERAEVAPLLRARPAPASLAPFVARLQAPAEVAAALRGDFDLDTPAARAWLSELAEAAGLAPEVLLGDGG